MIRDDEADLVFRNEGSASSTRSSTRSPRCRRPAGRSSSARSASRSPRVLSTMLKRRGIKHETLNAKFHEKESGIVAQAGRTGAVTIATNMAGRGTDIKLGGDPAGLASEMLHKQGLNPAEVDKETYDAALAEAKAITDEDHEKVVAAGGLHIIGTERHDSRRIDNQLRGRAGRQGDPGSSRFYLSLEDDLMKRFASDRVAGLMERLGLEDDVAIESRHRQQDDRERPEPGRGLQLRHAQARRRVRRRHQPPARDDLRRARQGPPQRGPERDGPGLPRGRDRGARRQPPLGESADDWGMEGLAAALKAMGLDDEPGTSEDDLWDLGGRDAIREHLLDVADAKLEAKAKEVGEEDWAMVERLVLLRTIDSLWVEHLTEIDDMRRGIGLRGYAQQDPLNEFRREAFELYEELRDLIRHQVASSIFRVTVTRQPPEAAPMTFDASKLPPRRSGSARNRGRGRRRGGRHGLGRERRRDRRPATGRHAPGRRDRGHGRRPRRRIRWRGRCASRRTARPRRPAGEAGLHPERRPDRPQRPVLLRLGPEVQEVSRSLTGEQGGDVRATAARAEGPHASRAGRGGRRAHRPRLHDVADLGPGQPRRRPSGRRDRRPRRGPVQRPVPSPIFRARLDHAIDLFEDGPRAVPRRDRRQGADGDRTTEAAAGPRVRDLEGRAGRRDPRRGPRPDDARVAPGGRDDPARPRRSHSAVFVSDRTHMLRVLRIARDEGIEAFGSPTRDEPDRRERRGAAPGDGPRARRAGVLLPRGQRAVAGGRRSFRVAHHSAADEPESRPKTARVTGFSLLAMGISRRILSKTPRPRGSVRIPSPRPRAAPHLPSRERDT